MAEELLIQIINDLKLDVRNLSQKVDDLLKEYVTKAEYLADLRRFEERHLSAEKDIADLHQLTEEFKANRLPRWASWVFPLIVSGIISISGCFLNYNINHPQQSFPTQVTAPAIKKIQQQDYLTPVKTVPVTTYAVEDGHTIPYLKD